MYATSTFAKSTIKNWCMDSTHSDVLRLERLKRVLEMHHGHGLMAIGYLSATSTSITTLPWSRDFVTWTNIILLYNSLHILVCKEITDEYEDFCLIL